MSDNSFKASSSASETLAPVQGRSISPLSGLHPLPVDPLLIGGEYVLIDLLDVVEMQALLLLTLKFLQARGMPPGLFLSSFHQHRRIPLDFATDRFLLATRQPDASVVALNRSLDLLDLHVTPVAALAAARPARASEATRSTSQPVRERG